MRRAKITYSSFQSPHYFDQLFLFFLIISFICTLAVIDYSKGFQIVYVVKYVLILFLILTIAVLYEMKNKSLYMSPMEVVRVRQFFNEFNYCEAREEHIHKYNSKTLKQLKKNIKKDIKYQLTNIIKKNKFYELHICEKDNNSQLYILKFLFRKNNHKLEIQEEKGEVKIIRIS